MTFRSWLNSFNKPRQRRARKNRHRASLRFEPLEQRLNLSALFPEFVDPNPAPGNQFGASVVPLSTGNVVVTSPFDDAGGPDAGAVYLFNGSNGALISKLHGSSAGDRVGSDGVTALDNGNFVVSSTRWDNGAVADTGAVTWGSGTTGVTGTVSAANSLVGTTAGDRVGSVTALANGNYVVASTRWDNGAIRDAGAVTWGSGTVGIAGAVSDTNSLVGSARSDRIGRSVSMLPNGNYIVSSSGWDNGAVRNVGAVTWGSGTVGVVGVVSPANSLVGSSGNDFVGSSGVTVLSNGNYVVVSERWANGAARFAGAVTWGSGSTGVAGVVSAANSLVGTATFDNVGNDGVTTLSNGNYVVLSPFWDNGAVRNVGAVTWGSGTSGVTGVVSAANSLVGSTVDDRLGFFFTVLPVTALSNGNYVVRSPQWDNGAVVDAGAVTWGSGATGITGTVSAANSLVGSQASDVIGDAGVTALSNGNFVVGSRNWDLGAVTNAGAATWGDGGVGITGRVSVANSLVGSSVSDNVGDDVTALTNGNYVVSSTRWDNGAVANAGAVTWGNGMTGVTGIVSAGNSLVGSSAEDQVGSGRVLISPGFLNVGGITALSNGNYVVQSMNWDNGSTEDAGAVTWGSGTSGVTGVVTAANSLVGSTANDRVGELVKELSNGSYVVLSRLWDNGAVANAGAVTWGSGTAGVTGAVSAANSLVGSQAGDLVGGWDVTALTNGNYVVQNPFWDNGAVSDAGAVTWGNGTTGVTGVVSAANSLVGSQLGDQVGFFVTALPNGNYVVPSSRWDNGLLVDAGAVTFGNGATGVVGSVTPVNSVIGTSVNTNLQAVVADNVNDTFFARFVQDDGGRVWVGSQESGFFPSISVPAAQTAYEDVDQALSGISIGDGGTVSLTFTLNVSHGTLTLGSTSGLTVTGNGTASVTLMGTTADLNVALASLVYRGNLNYSGGDTLSLAATDDFRSGSEASLAINVVSAADQASALQARVSALQNAGVLNKGQANSLIVKLNLKGNNGDVGKVRAFLRKVHALRHSRRLTQEQADALIELGEILLLSVKRR